MKILFTAVVNTVNNTLDDVLDTAHDGANQVGNAVSGGGAGGGGDGGSLYYHIGDDISSFFSDGWGIISDYIGEIPIAPILSVLFIGLFVWGMVNDEL